jgi:alkanesulfonate monooxygenase SsuD/methylene tetrahydromethanopterin reductase-like flavin-dependent oxidoreductase (luciferase family)
MRIGVFIGDVSGARTSIPELLDSAREAEARGFTSGWVPHLPWSLDALTALALAGQVTDTIELGTAVVPTYPRHPMAMAQQAMSTQAATNGRLALGIGPSHPVVIESMFGLSYDRPARHTREYVEVLRAAFAGTGHLEYHGEFFDFRCSRCRGPHPRRSSLPRSHRSCCGWRVRSPTAPSRTGPTSARSRTTSCRGSRRRPDGAGRPAPRVVVGLPVAVVDDVAEARERATKLFATYNAIPTYQRILARGDGAGPEDVAVIGSAHDVEARLRAYADAGATDLCAAPLGLGSDRDASWRDTVDLLASLAPDA